MAISKKQRLEVLNKLEGHCGYCGKEITMKTMQVDHMNPKAIRGLKNAIFDGVSEDFTDHIDNLMPSCSRCNHYKRAGTVEQFRHLLSYLHTRLMNIYIVKVAVDYGIIKIDKFDNIFYFEKVKNKKSDEQ